MKQEIKIKPLNIEHYIKGECFLCKQPCHSKGYLHFNCAVAFSEHKQKTIMDLQKKKEIKQDKELNKRIEEKLKQ